MPRAFFVSKVDAWLVAIGPLLCLAIAAAVLTVAIPFRSGVDKVLLLPVLLLTLVLPVWLFLDTNYTMTDDELRIRSGPFRWCIALNEVREVSPSRSWLSSPALSLDRLCIRYGASHSILVSPREKQRFVDCLRERCPTARITVF